MEPADAAGAGDQLVSLAADAEAGGCGREREHGHEQRERPAEHVEAEGERQGCAGQHDGSDRVREARRPGVLDRAFPETGLDELEVGDAR